MSRIWIIRNKKENKEKAKSFNGERENEMKKKTKKKSLRAGFEPAREYPIGFRVQRLNHSAIAAARDHHASNCIL